MCHALNHWKTSSPLLLPSSSPLLPWLFIFPGTAAEGDCVLHKSSSCGVPPPPVHGDPWWRYCNVYSVWWIYCEWKVRLCMPNTCPHAHTYTHSRVHCNICTPTHVLYIHIQCTDTVYVEYIALGNLCKLVHWLSSLTTVRFKYCNYPCTFHQLPVLSSCLL